MLFAHPPDVRRVVIVDDHELLRTGTRQILEAAPGFAVVGEAGDIDDALEVIDEHRPEVVLVDIRLPSGSGIDLARRIVREHPQATVLVLSAYDDDHYVRAALSAGVSGYLLKTTPGDDLVRSIEEACAGTPMVRGRGLGRGEKGDPIDRAGPSTRLTSREEEVVRLVGRGLSNKAIAQELGISPRTVEGHLNHVFEKLGISSRTELVHVALARTLFVRGPSDGDQHV